MGIKCARCLPSSSQGIGGIFSHLATKSERLKQMEGELKRTWEQSWIKISYQLAKLKTQSHGCKHMEVL